MATFLTSDEHYSHINIIKYSNRPFKDIDEMNNELIKRFNSVVGKDDETIHVGDFSLSDRITSEIVPQLNGSHILICGNHDACHPSHKKSKKITMVKYLDFGFKEVALEMQLFLPRLYKNVLVSHMPYTDIEGHGQKYQQYIPKDDGQFLIHGHIHTSWLSKGKMYNVGVDMHDYYPIPLSKVDDYFCSLSK